MSPPAKPLQIASITIDDIFRAMALGLRDMQRAPLHSLSFGLVYAGFGWFVLFLMFKLNWGSYAYPLATGFALVAPMAAAGLYEISRRLEFNLPVTYNGIFGAIFGEHGKNLTIMMVVSTFAYILWLDIAAAIYVAFWGLKNIRFENLVETILMTPKGLIFLTVGNAIGALLALGVFSIMVVSLPAIFDRDVDFVTAMISSVKTVLKNPKPMAIWCFIIGVLMVLSLCSLFAGLLVVFPFLGHTTWHIYRKTILPEAQAHQTLN